MSIQDLDQLDWSNQEVARLQAIRRGIKKNRRMKRVGRARMAPYREAVKGLLFFYAATAVFADISWQVCLLFSLAVATAVFIVTPPDSLGETEED
jgi:hypothetical protein